MPKQVKYFYIFLQTFKDQHNFELQRKPPREKKITKMVLNLWCNDDVTTKTCYYVKHVYCKLFRQSCVRKFWFGLLIIMIHSIFTIHARKMGKSEKGKNSATHILACKYYDWSNKHSKCLNWSIGNNFEICDVITIQGTMLLYILLVQNLNLVYWFSS